MDIHFANDEDAGKRETNCRNTNLHVNKACIGGNGNIPFLVTELAKEVHLKWMLMHGLAQWRFNTMNQDEPLTTTTCTSWLHNKHLHLGIQTLRENNLLLDCTLVAEDEFVPVHKMVLAALSDYFCVMFTGNMQESKENIVVLKGISASSLRSLVDFAYSGELDLCMDNVEDIVSTASYFQMTDAVQVCEQFLEQRRTFGNIVDILNLAERHALTNILKTTKEFIQLEFENIPEEILLKFSGEQLSGLVGRNSLSLRSEYHLFEKLAAWTKRKTNENEDTILELFSKVRYPLMSEDELFRVAQTDIFSSSSRYQDLLSEALQYHQDVLKQPLMQSERTQVRNDTKSVVLSSSSTLCILNNNQDYYGYVRLKDIEGYESADFRLKEVAVVDNFLYVSHVLHSRKRQKQVLFHRYDPRFDVWQKLSEPDMNWTQSLVLVPYKREIHAMDRGDQNTTELQTYSIQHDIWEKKTPVMNKSRFFAGIGFKDRTFISGGETLGLLNSEVYCYSPFTDSWESKAPMIQARKKHKMAVIGSRLYVFGGDYHDTVEYYQLDIDQWTSCAKPLKFRIYGLVPSDRSVYLLRMDQRYDDYSDMKEMDGVALEYYDPKTESTSPLILSAFTFQSRYKVMCASLTFPDIQCSRNCSEMSTS